MMNNTANSAQIIEKLAEAVHNLFCEEMKAKGYKWGPVTDDGKKRHSALVPYADLPEDEKEQNRSNARDIKNKLASLGYDIIPMDSHQACAGFNKEEIEKLSQEEHKRWLKQKIDSGWKYAPETDKAKKLHKDMVPWDKLKAADKEKDRIIVRGIPILLSKVGYTMGKKVPDRDLDVNR
jgi:hypothetical protein